MDALMPTSVLPKQGNKLPKNKAICAKCRKCLTCRKVCVSKEGRTHKCWHGKCPACKKYVNIRSHKCYIQPVSEEAHNVNLDFALAVPHDCKIVPKGSEEDDVAEEAVGFDGKSDRPTQEEVEIEEDRLFIDDDYDDDDDDDDAGDDDSLEQDPPLYQAQENSVQQEEEKSSVEAGTSPSQERKKSGNCQFPLFIYFDVETRQDDGEHVANLVVAETDEDDDPVVFSGEGCVAHFIEWLNEKKETFKRPIIVIAHNFKGYDSYFVLQHYYQQCVRPKQLVNGAKILTMTVGNIKFIDSLSFLPMALAEFEETFNIDQAKKGFFPSFV